MVETFLETLVVSPCPAGRCPKSTPDHSLASGLLEQPTTTSLALQYPTPHTDTHTHQPDPPRSKAKPRPGQTQCQEPQRAQGRAANLAELLASWWERPAAFFEKSTPQRAGGCLKWPSLWRSRSSIHHGSPNGGRESQARGFSPVSFSQLKTYRAARGGGQERGAF